MAVKIIGLIIGILVLGVGFLLSVEGKARPGSKKDLYRHQHCGRARRCRLRGAAASLSALCRREERRSGVTSVTPLFQTPKGFC